MQHVGKEESRIKWHDKGKQKSFNKLYQKPKITQGDDKIYSMGVGETSLRKRAVEPTEMTTVHFYFNHLQEGDESPLPELFISEVSFLLWKLEPAELLKGEEDCAQTSL